MIHCMNFTYSTSPDGNLAGMLLSDDGEPDPLPLDQSLYYMQQILQGVHHLHSCNIVHLNINGLFCAFGVQFRYVGLLQIAYHSLK